MALPFVFVSGTTILAAQVNANFAATALTDLSNLSLSKTAGNVIVGTGTGFASNALIAGSGITITPGVGTVTIASSGVTTLTIGTSAIASASNGYILYNNSGVLGNYGISGTGTTVAMATGATLTTPTFAAGGSLVTPQLTAPSYAQGEVWYDSGNDGLAYFNGATGNQVIAGQEVQIRVYNATASTIPIGTPVYITGAFSGIPTVSPCLNTSFAAAQCIGLTTQAIAASGTGYAMAAGTIRGINTSVYSAGDTLYVGSSAGTLVNTNPGSGYYATVVGYVSVVNASTGKITVMPGSPASSAGGGALTVGSSAISGGTTGRVLYDNAGVVGEYTQIPVAFGGTGLTTTPVNGQLLIGNGTGYTLATITAGANVTVTNSAGGITIAATGGGGGSLTVGTTTISGGTTGRILYDNAGVLGEYTTVPVALGGTGTSSPGLVAGTNVTITGSWPNQTINSSGGGAITINAQSGTAYTLVLGDARSMITMNNAAANTLTIPLNASVAFPTGTTVSIEQIGAGKTTIAATGGVTLNYLATLTASIAGQYGVAQLIKTGTDTWTLFGAIGG